MESEEVWIMNLLKQNQSDPGMTSHDFMVGTFKCLLAQCVRSQAPEFI